MLEGWAFCDYIWAYFIFFLFAGSIGGYFIADYATRNIESGFLSAIAGLPIFIIIWAMELNVLLHFLDTRCA